MNLEGATHLVLGDMSAERLRAAGAQSVIVLRDLLSVGRCAIDPRAHRAARLAQWKLDPADETILDGDALARTLLRIEGPIALWTSPTWPSRLYEWATIEWLSTTGLELSRVERAEIERHFCLEDIAATRAAALEPERVEVACELWRAYCDGSPLAFDALRMLGSPMYPDLRATCEGFGAWFPRRRGNVVRPSFGDELLLTSRPDLLHGWFGDGACDERRKGVRADAFAPLDVGGFRINDRASPWVREGPEDDWQIVAG